MTTLRFDDALVVGAQAVLALAGAWGVLLLLAAAAESLTRGRVDALARVGCPVAWRPLLLALLGTAVSLAGPAHAAPRGGEGPEALPGTTAAGADLLPVPARPVDGRVASSARPVVVVAPGDSLWAIARARLPDATPAARVQAFTDALHRANRAVIGPDPDLLHPGQRLRVPPAPTLREDPLP